MSEINDDQAHALLSKLKTQISQDFIGQSHVIDQVIIALLSNGHILVEGVPGLGKTLLVRTLAASFSGEFKRIQFTPDLMPTDVTGHVLFDMKESQFRVRPGPVFTNILLADEINRAPAKTQAALLEVMQERQVTFEGSTRALPYPFMVLATQNPVEQEGTYPLPEAELDRFIMKILIDYPNETDEIALTKKVTANNTFSKEFESEPEKVFSIDELKSLQNLVSNVMIDDKVLEYAVKLVRITRNSPSLNMGAGTRACLSLIRCAKAKSILDGKNFVTPDDIKEMAIPVMRHRVSLSAEMEIEGANADNVLKKLFNSVDAPRI